MIKVHAVIDTKILINYASMRDLDIKQSDSSK